MNEERITFTVKNSDGEDVEYEILFTFEDDLTGKNYMLYTDHSLDDDGCTKVFAASFEPDGELHPVETDEEWEMLGAILDQLQNEALAESDEE